MSKIQPVLSASKQFEGQDFARVALNASMLATAAIVLTYLASSISTTIAIHKGYEMGVKAGKLERLAEIKVLEGEKEGILNALWVLCWSPVTLLGRAYQALPGGSTAATPPQDVKPLTTLSSEELKPELPIPPLLQQLASFLNKETKLFVLGHALKNKEIIAAISVAAAASWVAFKTLWPNREKEKKPSS